MPPPGGKRRQREYVTGDPARTGGIQRFKLGLHGAQCAVAAIIGYPAKGTPSLWHDRINLWIRELAGLRPFEGEHRGIDEQLTGFAEDTAAGWAASNSAHPGTVGCASTSIRPQHLWIMMKPK